MIKYASVESRNRFFASSSQGGERKKQGWVEGEAVKGADKGEERGKAGGNKPNPQEQVTTHHLHHYSPMGKYQ